MDRILNTPGNPALSTEIILRLSRLAEYHDPDISSHLLRIGLYCQIVARYLGWPDKQVAIIGNAGPMHDIGKIGIPENILFKPGPLTSSEYELAKIHTTIGGEILSGSESPLLQMAERIALTHHERWDGTGYPERLAGETIPIEGRIVSVVDVFDALVGTRSYKEPLPVDKSVEVLREHSGKHFDPAIVDAFVKNLDKILKVYEDIF
ncbi:MAG: HD domain-containing phosphohydrolase [bacterium]